MSTKTELDALANFIMAEVPGEPSQSEGAGHTAIRIIRDQRARIEVLERDLRWVMDFAKGQEPWDDDGNVARFNQIEAALPKYTGTGVRDEEET